MTDYTEIISDIKNNKNELKCGLLNDSLNATLMIIAYELRKLNENIEKMTRRIQSDVI